MWNKGFDNQEAINLRLHLLLGQGPPIFSQFPHVLALFWEQIREVKF